MEKVKIIECPRDAWQGLEKIIPTEAKTAYLRKLIESGFRHLDAVSFVAPKYVPQTADSEAVMRSLAESVLKPNGSAAKVEIIGIVVNARGIERALATPGVTTLGYPYSVSAHFRRTNSNMSQSESRRLVEKLVPDAESSGRELVAYGSMAFGNSWDEPWGPELMEEAVRWLVAAGIKTKFRLPTRPVLRTPEASAIWFAACGRFAVTSSWASTSTAGRKAQWRRSRRRSTLDAVGLIPP